MKCEPPLTERRTGRRGQCLLTAGETGPAWRVVEGIVRLDLPVPFGEEPGEEHFVGITWGGDLIGAEALMFGRYGYTATAVTPVVLEGWSQVAAKEPAALLYARFERRMGEVLRLRAGKAPERIARLFALAQEAGAEPPRLRLRDIAAITGLRIETVSRTLKAMEAGGLS